MIVFKRFIASCYLFAAVAINLKSQYQHRQTILILIAAIKELRFCDEKNSDIRDYQHKVLIQREIKVNGM